ncbi:MAG: hypothetical protein Q9227_007092 [Pyrenula ochraceoflavens]
MDGETRRAQIALDELESCCKTRDALKSFYSFRKQYRAYKYKGLPDSGRGDLPKAPPPAYSLLDSKPFPQLSTLDSRMMKQIYTNHANNNPEGMVKSKTMGNLQTLSPQLNLSPLDSSKHADSYGSTTHHVAVPDTPCGSLGTKRRALTNGTDAISPLQPATAKLRRRHTDVNDTWNPLSPTGNIPNSQTSAWLQSGTSRTPFGPNVPQTPRISNSPKYSTAKPAATFKTPEKGTRKRDSIVSDGSGSKKSSGSGADMLRRVFSDGIGAVKRIGRNFTGSELAASPTESHEVLERKDEEGRDAMKYARVR